MNRTHCLLLLLQVITSVLCLNCILTQKMVLVRELTTTHTNWALFSSAFREQKNRRTLGQPNCFEVTVAICYGPQADFAGPLAFCQVRRLQLKLSQAPPSHADRRGTQWWKEESAIPERHVLLALRLQSRNKQTKTATVRNMACIF